jgi:hypothetical protein
MSAKSKSGEVGGEIAAERGPNAAEHSRETFHDAAKRLRIQIRASRFEEEKDSGLPDVFPCR